MTESDRVVTDTWEFVCEWYRPDRVHRSVQNGASDIPSTEDLETFSRWLTEQYRLAMRKGIELAIEAVNERDVLPLNDRIEQLQAELAEANRLKDMYAQSCSELQAGMADLNRVHAIVMCERDNLRLESQKLATDNKVLQNEIDTHACYCGHCACQSCHDAKQEMNDQEWQ